MLVANTRGKRPLSGRVGGKGHGSSCCARASTTVNLLRRVVWAMMSEEKPTSQFALAADVGGTQLRAALISRGGQVLARSACATEPERGIEHAAERLAELLQPALVAAGSDGVVGLGIATAGPLDPETGIYQNPPNLQGWDQKSLKPLLTDALGVPVFVGHDATMAALAETCFGPNKGAENLIYITISTGIGGGIVANGDILSGASGGAGEVGHITIRPGEGKCGVGCDGCLEGNASGPIIAQKARDRLRQGRSSQMSALCGGDIAVIDTRHVFAAAGQGDECAREIILETIENLGIGFASLLNVFDPEVIVLGGGVTVGLRPWWTELVAAIEAHALRRYRGRVPLRETTLGGDVGLLGAAILAFRRGIKK